MSLVTSSGGWELPASEGGRSSLIRREMNEAGEIMGTDAAGWVLASDTMLDGAYRTTYYGHADDIGTPDMTLVVRCQSNCPVSVPNAIRSLARL